MTKGIKENWIRVLVKKPGEPIKEDLIENKLEAFQQIVGGYIQTVMITTTENVVMICNEEGKLLGLPHNFYFAGDHIVGTVIFVSQKDDDFTGIRPKAAKYVYQRFDWRV